MIDTRENNNSPTRLERSFYVDSLMIRAFYSQALKESLCKVEIGQSFSTFLTFSGFSAVIWNDVICQKLFDEFHDCLILVLLLHIFSGFCFVSFVNFFRQFKVFS